MVAGRTLQAGGLRLVLLVTVVRWRCAAAGDGTSQENVLLLVGIIAFIVFASIIYVAVSCGYYHCVLRPHQKCSSSECSGTTARSEQSPTAKDSGELRIEGIDEVPVALESYSQGGNLKLPADGGSLDDTHPKDLAEAAREASDEYVAREHSHGLGPADLDLPEGLTPTGVEIGPVAEVADTARNLRQRPQAPGFLKLPPVSPSQDINSIVSEAPPVSRCCSVLDWCSATSSQGLPAAGPVAGPPGAPRAPCSIPKGRLCL